MNKNLDRCTRNIDNASEALSRAFADFEGDMDSQLQDCLNKADQWINSALSRCEELGGRRS